MRKLLSAVPLGGWGIPQEIAVAAIFLASDDTQFITGITLPVYVGWATAL
jgi:NAD(P)-dependent dehydrogenase (short-subunit alcohol dehydrogenase family)